jgi:AraC-like DNA-binding protein/mannose-6-phosphate isomerase-like protein (cupin superfamily)
MAMSGQVLSQDGQNRLRVSEEAPRPMAGYANDYPPGHDTGLHRHPRAQLLFAVAGVMRVTTERALFTVPPGTGLWVPAGTAHAVRMDGPVRMRSLFLRADAAAAGPAATTVIAISSLLRELILAVCGEPAAWDSEGPIALVAALAVHEITRAGTRPLSLPACRDPRLARVAAVLTADPADPRDLAAHAEAAGASVRTLARLFRAETGMTFQQWRRQLRMTEAMARIANGDPLARVAAAVGYTRVAAFSAAFRAVFGTTPSGRPAQIPGKLHAFV